MQDKILKALAQTRAASVSLITATEEQINAVLLDLAKLTRAHQQTLLIANGKDLERMDPADPKYDRLLLNPQRLEEICLDLEKVAGFDSPLNQVLHQHTHENGLQLSKIRTPLGVVAVVYESRPNVTFDVFSLCLKSGNACVLKGSRDADDSNRAIIALIHQALTNNQLPTELAWLAPAEREALGVILNAVSMIDVAIPRGSQGLIDYVRENARIPVIETGAGIVHTYVDESADLVKAAAIVLNAKTRRVSVCNALDTLLLHQSLLPQLAELVSALGQDHQVKIHADADAYAALENLYPGPLELASEADFGREFLDYEMSIKVVDSLDQALAHIARYSSGHSEAIVAEDPVAIETFLQRVDAAAVYANASTAFTDGGQFGMGAEIGISTQKLHARGPMALAELTSYKWVVRGSGQVRS